jgi:hypothetical protein
MTYSGGSKYEDGLLETCQATQRLIHKAHRICQPQGGHRRHDGQEDLSSTMTHTHIQKTRRPIREDLSRRRHISLPPPGIHEKHDDLRKKYFFLSPSILYRYGTTQHTSSSKGKREDLRSRDETWKEETREQQRTDSTRQKEGEKKRP